MSENLKENISIPIKNIQRKQKDKENTPPGQLINKPQTYYTIYIMKIMIAISLLNQINIIWPLWRKDSRKDIRSLIIHTMGCEYIVIKIPGRCWEWQDSFLISPIPLTHKHTETKAS